jgi:hypothetical protein
MSEFVPPEALIDDLPLRLQVIAERLRVLVLGAEPGAIERVRAGWNVIGYDVPTRRGSAFFAWLMPQRQHVHLGFRQGVLLDDPDGLLGGDAKLARWVTLQAGDEVDEVGLASLVREAARIARLSPAERRAHAEDRSLQEGALGD